jgi:predicted hotdog family 3-hydroxylacyl-ACP dehydratase
MTGPATLDRAGIAARIPHRDRMCLLDRLVHWTMEGIDCRSASHRDADNPLRSAGGLLAPCAIEYAAQAMALHGSLVAPSGDAPRPGYLASVRQVRLSVATLHDVPGELQVRHRRRARPWAWSRPTGRARR